MPAHWPLIQEDTPADACYVILEGQADVAIGGTVVATLDTGSVVGEMALASGRLRNATVTSSTPLDLLHIDVGQFDALLARRPALREALPEADIRVDQSETPGNPHPPMANRRLVEDLGFRPRYDFRRGIEDYVARIRAFDAYRG